MCLVRSLNLICHYTLKTIENLWQNRNIHFVAEFPEHVEKNGMPENRYFSGLFWWLVIYGYLKLWCERFSRNARKTRISLQLAALSRLPRCPTWFRFISRKNPRVETIEFPRCFRFVVKLRARYYGQCNASSD